MKTLDEYLKESIEHYKTLAAETAALGGEINTLSPALILQRCDKIKKLQQKLAESDVDLNEIMAFLGHEVLDNPLVGEYQRALDTAIQEADSIDSKARMRKIRLLEEIEKKQGLLKKDSKPSVIDNGHTYLIQ